MADAKSIEELKVGDVVYLFPVSYSFLDGCVKTVVTEIFNDYIHVWVDSVTYVIYKEDETKLQVFRDKRSRYIMGSYFLNEKEFIERVMRYQEEKDKHKQQIIKYFGGDLYEQ